MEKLIVIISEFSIIESFNFFAVPKYSILYIDKQGGNNETKYFSD